MENKILNAFDFIFNKLLPKKFIVFIVATIIVMNKYIVPTEYWEILKYYMIGGAVVSTGNLVSKNLSNSKKDKPEWYI